MEIEAAACRTQSKPSVRPRGRCHQSVLEKGISWFAKAPLAVPRDVVLN